MAASPHTCSSACQCASQHPPPLPHTHTVCAHLALCGTGEQWPEESCLCSHIALKKSVLMISFSLSLWPCFLRSLCFYLLSFFLCHSHHFLSPVVTEKIVLIISTPHPSPLLVCLSLSFSPFIHLLNRPCRQTHLFTGVHSVHKVFKHHWMLLRGQSSVGVDT